MGDPVRIVFLDFDGVLNSRAFGARLREAGREVSSTMGLDPEAVGRLNRLDAEFVVSSTWRHGRTLGMLDELLRAAGFTGALRGTTPRRLRTPTGGSHSEGRRGHEIQAWLEGAPDYGLSVESFAVVDDDSDMAHLADRLVKTDFATGLLDEHVDRITELLDRPAPLIVLPWTGGKPRTWRAG